MWFKVDDTLHSHSKVDDATVAAMGLWVLAGSWASNQLTDGFVPAARAARIDPEFYRERAAFLVRAGFWHADASCACVPEDSPLRAGREGWQFHDWRDSQPSRDQVKAERAATADRQRRWRERRAAARNGAGSTVTPDVTQRAPNGTTDGSNDVLKTSTRPDPTRPPLKGQGRGRGDHEDSGVPIDQEDLKQRLAERAYAGGQTDDTVRNAAIAEMRSKLPPGTSLTRWPKQNGEPQ